MKKKTKDALINILLVLVFIIGLGLFLYPTISDIYGKYRDSKLIKTYKREYKSLSAEMKQEEFDKAVAYNNSLINSSIVNGAQYKDRTEDSEKELYESLLNLSQSSIMGYIDIPSIAVTLPLYHWSTDSVLNKGVGHIHGSSLPVGCGVSPEEEGYNTIHGSHCAFIAHRGLPSSKLFSDLDEMKTGDMFYINILGNVLAYKVYEVEIVLPTEVENLKIEHGKDLVTLITCTPYGVNTHRILVKGERVEYKGETTTAPMSKVIKKTVDPKTVAGLGLMAFGIFFILYNKKQKKKRKLKNTAAEEIKENHNDEET